MSMGWQAAVAWMATGFLSGYADVVYVDHTVVGGDGSSWGQAFASVEDALAHGGGNEIWVAEGVYAPTHPLEPSAGTRLLGGFTGTETEVAQRDPAANPTILDSQSNLNHAIRILPPAHSVRVDGFEIRNGRALSGIDYETYAAGVLVLATGAVIAKCTFSNNVSTSVGGAVLVQFVDTRIEDTVFLKNHSGLGGALGLNGTTGVVVRGCTFVGNTATGSSAGAVWVLGGDPVFEASRFLTNSARQGAAVEATYANLTFTGCTFTANTADLFGGGLSLIWSTVRVETCRFEANVAEVDNGGGLWSYYSPVTLLDSTWVSNRAVYGGGIQLDYKLPIPWTDRVERCRFVGNLAALEGGGIHAYARSLAVNNTLIWGNHATDGGGIRTHGGDGGDRNTTMAVTLIHCLMVGNRATNYGGGMVNSYVSNVVFRNSIVWSNRCWATNWDPWTGTYIQARDVFNATSSGFMTDHTLMETLTNNHYAAGVETHIGGLDEPPRFLNPTGEDGLAGTEDDDFRLRADSPAIDRANGWFAPAHDGVGSPRVDALGRDNLGSHNPPYADLGPLEWQAPAWTGITRTTNGVRLTLDGVPLPETAALSDTAGIGLAAWGDDANETGIVDGVTGDLRVYEPDPGPAFRVFRAVMNGGGGR